MGGNLICIVKLTKEEVTSIIEKAEVDKEKLSDLISLVNDALKSNNEKAEAIKNITGLEEVAVSLIGKLI
jgi:predicted transcriptional regulator